MNTGTCPRCKTENEYSKLVCEACGARLPWADAVSPSPALATVTPDDFFSDTPPKWTPLAPLPDTIPAPQKPLPYRRDIVHLESNEVNNGFVWLLAFVPIWGWALTGIIAGAWQVSVSSLFWVLPLLNWGLCVLDGMYLESKGENLGIGSWAILVPIYLFMRAERLKQDPTYAWVWLITFLFSLMPLFVVVRVPRF